MALRGNGLPRLASWPAPPPAVRSFLRLAPSTNTFTWFALDPPAEKVREVPLMRSSVTVTPGESAARSRKLRLGVGRGGICSGGTLGATSEVRGSPTGAAATRSEEHT